MNAPRPKLLTTGRTEKLRRRFRPSCERLDEPINPVLSPLVQPATISSFNGVADVLTTTLTMAQTPAVIGDTAVTNAFTYNGTYVGPTLRADPGDTLAI